MSIDNREAAWLMRTLTTERRNELIRAAGDKVVDLREVFARERAQRRMGVEL
jgi:hypothetical protein